MAKIFVHGKAADVCSAWFEADETTAPFNAKLFKIKFGNQPSAEGTFVLGAPLIINGVAVKDQDTDKRLATWKEAVENASGEAQRLAAQELHQLHDKLRGLAIKADGSTQYGAVAQFVDIVGVADVTTGFHLEINPAGLLADVGADEPVFRAHAEASFSAGFDSPFAVAGLDAVVIVDVELTRQNALRMLPRIDVPALPHLGLSFPHIPLPTWTLKGVKLPKIDLSFLRIPLQADLDLKIEFSPDKPDIEFDVTNSKLTIKTAPVTATVKFAGADILIADGVALIISGTKVAVAASNISASAKTGQKTDIDLRDKLPGPFVVALYGVVATITISGPATGPLAVLVNLKIDKAVISARSDPSLVLAMSAEISLTYAGAQMKPELVRLDVVEPYSIKLALFAAHVIEDQARRLMSLIHKIEVPKPDAPGTPEVPNLEGFLAVLRRIGALAAAAAGWLAQQGAAGVRALAGIAEAAFKLVAEAVSTLADFIKNAGQDAQTVARYVTVEVRIDLTRWRVVQIVILPSDPAATTKAFTREVLGFKLEIPFELTPGLVCDLENNRLALALLSEGVGSKTAKLSTDLWLGHDNGPVEPVSGTEKVTPNSPLLQVSATPSNQKVAVALVVIDNGRASFFQTLKTDPTTTPIPPTGQVVVAAGHPLLGARWSGYEKFSTSDFAITASVNTNRILSLFRAPKVTDDPLDQFSQSIKVIRTGKVEVSGSRLRIPIEVEIKISETKFATTLNIDIDLDTLSMSVAGGKFFIEVQRNETFSLLGLSGKFLELQKPTQNPPPPFKPLFLDFSDGDPRLGLNKKVAKIVLSYNQLSTSGSSLDFEVDQFIVSRDGIDLSAQVSSNPVTLAGVDMPFRFDQGQLSIKRSQIQTFALTGHGNLPPALVGEAKASIELNFAQDNGRLGLQAAKAVLDKGADPLRCEGTQFTISVTKLGLKFVQQGGYHFYFTLTGSADFRPSSGAFSEGLLKNLSSLRIVLDEAPLASDPRVLLNHIEFQVTVEPPKRSTFFDLFSFELRGVGFHPSAQEFSGSPAFSISGQVNFTDFGDIATPRFDFHKLWIAPPETGKSLPRVRFDGLGVALAIGSMAEASGTATAVDGKLPTLFKPDVLPANVTANGFLASGSLRIQGWASMSASMGFLQLEKQGVAEKRPAFFLYVQRNDMSEKVPTPIGTIFLREVGFGFGYRYTLAGIAAAERAESPRELVKILDEVSKYAGNLDDVKAWWPTYDNAAVTLALRGMFSLTSVSTTSKYNAEGEENLPNLALFDVVVALRTDLTFLMNLRIWVAYNYADWRKGKFNNDPWTSNPSLTGYMYLSVPRREFLARAVFNPGAEIGNHPELPSELKRAMRAVRWSSTLYIRPGLFHMEYGWPYELGFSIGQPGGNFYLTVEGGTVLRFEDAAILYGLAFRARGYAAFSYNTGGDFGASITAHADLALGAKLIAYLSANISQSMFYGVITLDITLEFSVQMWLRTRWFSLSCGFSQSITIHIGVELLVQPAGLAARIEASVSVGAFGRTLSLGIGFSIGNGGQLAEARARVERFLALGLGSSYPNPEAGVPVSRPTPLPEPSRADNAVKSDDRLDQAVDRREATANPQDSTSTNPVDKLVGVEFGEVSYWALLIPILAPRETADDFYVVQLIPRDNVPLGEKDSTSRSHFYAAPLLDADTTPTYVVSGIEDEKELLTKAKKKIGPTTYEIRTDWEAMFGLDVDNTGNGQGTKRPTLKLAFQQACFMAPGDLGGTHYDATDIESVPWETEPKLLPDDPEAANIAIAAAARSRADCGLRFKQMQQVEEARSCFIATLAESAQQMAGLFSFVNNEPLLDNNAESYIASKLEFDPRALGLTLVMSGKRIDKLFPDRDRKGTVPKTSTAFTVRTRVPRTSGPNTDPPAEAVTLFNPPERMFCSMSPVLKDVTLDVTTTGVKASWDLEPDWERSTTPYSDPEFHLKHYRVERTIENLGSPPQGAPRPGAMNFTVKSADHIEIVATKENGKITLAKRRLRTKLQFVDDLKDIDAAIRAALLPPVLATDPADKSDIVIGGTRIKYKIEAVDCAGTSTRFDNQHPKPVDKIKTPDKGVLKAIARFHYDAVPHLHDTTEVDGDFIAFTVEEEESEASALAAKTDETRPIELPAQTDYILRIRTERTIAVGKFGEDALSQARNEPPQPRREDAAGKNEEDIKLLKKEVKGSTAVLVNRVGRRIKTRPTAGAPPEQAPEPEQPQRYWIAEDNWATLLERLEVRPNALNGVARLRAARLFVRPAYDETMPAELRPEWCPVQLQLEIGKKPKGIGKKFEPAVSATIERFEHPVDVKFEPFQSRFIFPSSGQLYLHYPDPNATFDSFCDNSKRPFTLLCDADQRTGVKLAWTARPDHVAVQPGPKLARKDKGKIKLEDDDDGDDRKLAHELHTLIAGYDLFALDATVVNDKHGAIPLQSVAPIGRAQRLPAIDRGQEPPETGDFARVAALYPSETKRLDPNVLDRRFGKRRTTWYSPSESFLIWPKRPLRRSLLTLLEENDLAALFRFKRPTKIKVEWVALPPGEGEIGFGFASESPGDPPTPIRDNILSGRYLNEPDGAALTVDQARRLLRGLVVVGDLGKRDDLADKTPDTFAKLQVRLTAQDKGGDLVDRGQPISVTIDLSLAPSLHPILADVLDVLHYYTDKDISYRRYEPVLESAPQLNADSLAAYLDETAADRDPAGWGILRTLGLAASLRLYDVEDGQFLTSDKALPMLQRALNLVLPRYREAPYASGAPFVDVMFTIDGVAELVPPHGAAPPPRTTNVLRDSNALALMQIELRPTVQPLRKTGDQDPNSPLRRRCVRYATLRLLKEVKSVKLHVPGDGDRIAIEIEPLVPTDGSSKRRVLMMQGWGDQPKFPIDGETVSKTLTLQTAGRKVIDGKPSEADLAYVRLVALDDTCDLSDRYLELLNFADGAACFVGASETAVEHAGPWGRFAILPDSWVAALLFGVGLPPLPTGPGRSDESAPNNTITTLVGILSRFPGKSEKITQPQDDKQRVELAARLGRWTRRFMEQGPANAVGDAPGLAFAMLTRPNPWRLAPDQDGLLSITVIETDRRGKARKYGVRPYGRYENLVQAVETKEETDRAKPGAPTKTSLAVQDFEESILQADRPDALRQFFADAVIERTEPLPAPVILATRRNDTLDEDGVMRPGQSVQIIVSRHPEEILSDANTGVDAALSVRHVAVGFWREFAAPKWAALVDAAVSNQVVVDVLEPFGPFKGKQHDYAKLPWPKGLSLIKDAMREQYARIDVEDVDVWLLREMYERHPDLWRGAYVLNMAAMPYGFRLHATAHVAAGVVVSPSSVATIEESGYQLILPWTLTLGATGAWQDRKVEPKPLWSIDRPTAEDKKVKVVIEWPLVRIVDGLFQEARDIWLGKEDAPNLYRLPDPAVSYRFSVETDDGSARVGEIEIGAMTNDPETPTDLRKALYLPQPIGVRFIEPDLEKTLTLQPGMPTPKTAYTHYAAKLTLQVKGEPDVSGQPVLQNFAPAALKPPAVNALTPADLVLTPADIAEWGAIAPQPNVNGAFGTLVLTVTPPPVPDPLPPPSPPPPAQAWKDFRTRLQAFVDAMQSYVNGSGSERFKQIAKSVADQVRPYVVDRVANWPGPKPGGVAQQVALNVPWIAGLPAEGFPDIAVVAPANWFWPPDPSEATTSGDARAKIKTVLDKAIAAAAANPARVATLQALEDSVLTAMRARVISRRRSVDEAYKHDLRPIRAEIPPTTVIDIATLKNLPADSPVDFLTTYHLPANAGRTAQDVADAFQALESEPNTADTLASLADMMAQPGAAADIAMRWSCRDAVEKQLKNTLQPASGPDFKTMILVKPATRSETAALSPSTLLKAKRPKRGNRAGIAADQSLTTLADDLTKTMVLGPRRRLVIQAFHGLAKPQDDVVERGR